MSNLAIIVDGLSKRYRIGGPAAANGRRTVGRLLASPFRYLASTLREPEADEVLWALQDVSFEVDHGEVIGIVGRNGAGKSTLLKVLARITEPTRGRAIVNGRVGSLLEVGTGFHPELTGRENVYLSGAILGMKRAEIDHKFDEIVSFAGVERFLNTQVKRYSSGMYVRLAFAVAAHLEPEILLVDEVLAVGDAAFQKKCLGKMGDVASEGRTVLFVSHNMIAVQNLCQRVIWLGDGQVMSEGPTNEVVSRYLSAAFSSQTEQVWPDPATAPGNEIVRLHRVCIRPEGGLSSDPIQMSSSLVVEIEYWNLIPDARLHACLHIYNEQQIIAFTTSSNETDLMTRDNPLPAGLFRSVCHIPANLLNSGLHRIVLLLLRNGLKIIFRHEEALLFEVLELGERPGAWFGKEPGAIRPILDWETEILSKP
jgi:lipopolysaccharide transport system ATP-binding protein